MNRWRPLGRRGAGTLGCLLSLLLFVVVLYYGVHIGEVFYRYYQYRDAIASAARFAPSLPDDVLRTRILDRADELGMPSEARFLRIRRVGQPNRILISTTYEEHVDLPFFSHAFTFSPRVEAPL